MKSFGRIMKSALLALGFISLFNLAVRAESIGSGQSEPFKLDTRNAAPANTSLPFTAQVRGEVQVPASMAAPTAVATKVVRVPDTRRIEELSREIGTKDAEVARLLDRNLELARDNDRLLAERDRREERRLPWWVWPLVALVALILAVLGLIDARNDARNNGRSVTVNNTVPNPPAPCSCSRSCGCDQEGFVLKLGRELREGDHIVVANQHKCTSHTERYEVGGRAKLDIRLGEIPEEVDPSKPQPGPEGGDSKK